MSFYNHGELVVKMNRWNREDTAEVFQNGFTRFVLNGEELPMCSMDNINPVFAQHYLEFRGWTVSQRLVEAHI